MSGLITPFSIEDNEKFLLTLIEQSIDGMILLDAEGVVQFSNAVAQAMFSDRVEDLQGYPLGVPALDEPVEILFSSTNGPRTIEMRAKVISWRDQEVYLLTLRDITEWAQLKQERAEQERLLRETKAMARVGGWEINLTDETVWWSRVTREIHQVPEDFTPKLEEALEFFPGEGRDKLEAAIKRLREEGIPYDLELPFKTAKGKRLWVRTKGQAVFEDDECVRLWGTFQDITERKQAEIELRNNERKYKQLFRNSLNGIALMQVDFDARGKLEDVVYLEINPAFEDLLNLRRSEVVNKSALEVFPEIRDSFIWDIYSEVGRTGAAERFEFYYQSLGKYFLVTCYSPAKNRIAMIFNDITDRKEEEEALQKSERKFHTLFETMSQGVVYQNTQGEIIDANPSAIKILGLTLDEVQGRTSTNPEWRVVTLEGEPFPGEKYPGLVALQTGEKVEDIVLGVYNPTREGVVWISVSAVPQFREGESKPYQVFTTFLDVTERVEAERALAERLKELQCIANLGSLLQREEDFDTICQRILEEIVRAMHCPEHAAPVMRIGERSCKGENFNTALSHGLQSSIRIQEETVGSIEVYYPEEKQFLLPEEQHLLDRIAEQLGLWYASWESRQALIESERRFRNALENAPLPVRIHADDGEIILINQAWSESSGYSLEEIPDLQTWVHKAYRQPKEAVPGLLTHLFHADGRVQDGEYHIQTKAGETLIWDFHSAFLGTMPDGRRLIISMVVDLTERIRAEDELQRYFARIVALREVDQLIGSTLDLDKVLNRITSELNKLIDFDSMAVILREEEHLKVIACHGFEDPDEILGLQIPFDPGHPNYKVIHQRKPLRFRNIIKSFPRFTEIMGVDVVHKIRSWMGVPLVDQERVIGMLTIDRYEEDEFTPEDVEIAIQFGRRAAIAITNASLYEQSQQHLAMLQTLQEVNQAISSSLDLNQVLEKITSEMRKIVDFETMSVQLKRRDSLEIIAAQGFTEPDKVVGIHFPLVPELPNYAVIRSRKPVAYENISEVYPHFEKATAPYQKGEIVSWLGIPLISQGEVIGMFTVDRKKADPYTETEIEIAQEFANLAAIAIRNAQLYEQVESQLYQLQILRWIDNTITSSLELPEALSIIIKQVRNGLGVDAACILLYDKDQDRLVFERSTCFNGESALAEGSFHLKEKLAEEVASRRKAIFIPNLTSEEGSNFVTPGETEEKFVSFYGFPLITKGALIGVLEIFHREELHPDDAWFTFAQSLGGQTAIAIDNITLFHDLETANAELRKAYDATIKGWAQALELRDKETSGHSERVVGLSIQIAKKFGFNGEDLDHIRRGVFIHDIGKMGIPDEILRKEGPLSEDEWAIMKQHPIFAYEMLKDIDYLEPALDIPHYHHERWDGSGYPEGLKGEEIPLWARIFAVADIYDALISNRPYRAAWSKEKAIQYIKEQAGREVDPEVVAVFLEIFSEDENK